MCSLFHILSARGDAETVNIAERPLHVSRQASNAVDTLLFGVPASEQAHGFVAGSSAIVEGGLGRPCRIINPDPSIKDRYVGGVVKFTIKCDPAEQNYITLKLWGGETGANTLYLGHDGIRIGSNFSDWPPIDRLNWRKKIPPFPGRFFYTTYLIPWHITKGKTSIQLELISTGYLYGYAPTYENAIRPQGGPSRGIYAATIHVDPFFSPAPQEKQGVKPPTPVIRPYPDNIRNPLDQMIAEAEKSLRVNPATHPRDPLGQAYAYHAEWSSLYHRDDVVRAIVRGVDAHIKKHKRDIGKLGWMGIGELAYSICLLHHEITRMGLYDESVQLKNKTVQRKKLYGNFFAKGLAFQMTDNARRDLANQVIYATTSIYRTHLLLKKIALERSISDQRALDLVYMAMGIMPDDRKNMFPDRDNKTRHKYVIGGPVFFRDPWDYSWVSKKGSSKEHGFEAIYGEMAYQTAELAELTGDPRVKQKAIQMIKSRAPFRHLGSGGDGYLAVLIESPVSYRHCWYPGGIQYQDVFFRAADVFGDPVSIRLAQLLIQHNRHVPYDSRHSDLMVRRVNGYKRVSKLPRSDFRLPMGDDQPDFAWSDEEIATVAFKHRGCKMWAVLRWRAAGINHIGRIHYTTDTIDRIANVRIHTKFTPSGHVITRPQERHVNVTPKGMKLATDGEVMQMADGPLAGQGNLYLCSYGGYFIIMNTSQEKAFTVNIPSGLRNRTVVDLMTNKEFRLPESIKMGKQKTMVLWTR